MLWDGFLGRGFSRSEGKALRFRESEEEAMARPMSRLKDLDRSHGLAMFVFVR